MWKGEGELGPPFIELNLETPQFSRSAATGIMSTGKTRTVMPVSVNRQETPSFQDFYHSLKLAIVTVGSD
jgi:hypothetical protein